MPFAEGARLDHYEILGPLGSGGMGEVYRAFDSQLRREVALKILPLRFSADPLRLARFEREAHLLASLNHPNIAAIYGVGQSGDTRFLVLELVEGQTLAERLRSGPIELAEALRIAAGIAEALEAAHENGVVHRDLKPANVKITPQGKVKVLDFGLAKALGDSDPSLSATGSETAQSTITLEETRAGVVIGTAAYMSPEQAEGKATDKRSDVWSFGVVLYEMLSGKRCFDGKSTSHVIVHVLEDNPDYTRLPETVSPGVRHLLQRCLQKNPAQRLRDVGDLRLQLEAIAQEKTSASKVMGAAAAARHEHRWLWPVLGGFAGVLAVMAVLLWAPWRSQSNLAPVRFEVTESDQMRFFGGGAMAVSPDGHWMVFPAISKDGLARYWVRSLDTVEARQLPGTERAYVPAAWSADSRYVLFTALGDRKLRKVDIQGGPPQTLADLPNQLNGATSNKDGVLIVGVAPGGPTPLLRVSESGGAPVPVTKIEKGESRHAWPQFLPDGHHFLYQRVSANPNQMGVYIGSIDVKPEAQSLKRLMATNRQAYYAASPNGRPGNLIFLRDSTLMSQPFDPGRMELSGDPVPIAGNVDAFPIAFYGLFSVSDTGVLVYRVGGGSKLALTWVDQNGNATGTLGEPGDYANPAISPDGTRVAVGLGPSGSRDIWLLDVGRGTSTRFTFDPADDDYPVWSPDGKSVVFASTRTGQSKLYIKPADGSAEERLLASVGVPARARSWSKDGRFLLFATQSPKTRIDLWSLANPTAASGAAESSFPIPFLASPFNDGQFDARFSPDGRWIAYTSDESSVSDVFVRPFGGKANTAGGAKWLVSKTSSIFPRWRGDGKELYYATTSTEIMAVDVETSKGFQAGIPRRLFTAPPPLLSVGWDITQDGKRFLFVTTPNGGRPQPFTVVLNWEAGLKK